MYVCLFIILVETAWEIRLRHGWVWVEKSFFKDRDIQWKQTKNQLNFSQFIHDSHWSTTSWLISDGG